MLTFSRKVRPPKRTERNEAQTLAERAKKYVERMPAAVAGQGGHGATFAVAVALVHSFGLSDAEAWPILCDYNGRARPPWSERELRHKLESTGKLTRHSKPRGHLRGVNDLPKYFPNAKEPEREAWEVKPEPLPSKHPQKPGQASSIASGPDAAEAARIAGELLKLHHDGVINGPHDPEAGFYARVLHTFGATYNREE